MCVSDRSNGQILVIHKIPDVQGIHHCQLPQDGGATKGEASFRRPERIRAAEPEDILRQVVRSCCSALWMRLRRLQEVNGGL